MGLRRFSEVWVVDFEFCAPPGERPQPICMVGREYFTGEARRLWFDGLSPTSTPPFDIGREALFVAYFASAELGCFRANGWPDPSNVLDLFVEFRRTTNGTATLAGQGLLGALIHFGLRAIDAAEKQDMRNLAMRGGPYTASERKLLLDYCESDVVSTCDLLRAMQPDFEGSAQLSRALLRGRYMKAVASMEWAGVPVDTGTLYDLRANWTQMQDELIRKIDFDYGVFEGRTFKRSLFADWLIRTGIPWSSLPSGELALTAR